MKAINSLKPICTVFLSMGLFLIAQITLALSIEPANISVKPGESIVLNVQGATSGPYKWRIPAGYLTSVFGEEPLSLGNQGYAEGAVQYHASKRAGFYEIEVTVGESKATATVNVYLNLVVSPTKIQIKPGETMPLQAYGGVPPFNWHTDQGKIDVDNGNTAKAIFSAADFAETTVQVQDAMGNLAIVPVNIITPISVTPERIKLTPGTSKLIQLSGGFPPFTSIVKTGSGQLEDTGARTIRFTAPNIWGESVIEIMDATGQVVTVAIEMLAPLTINPSNISLDKGVVERFQISGGEAPYQVSAQRGIAACEQIGECTYIAPALYGPDIIEVQDNSQKQVVVWITVEGGTPNILPDNPTLQTGEMGVFSVEGGCSPLRVGDHPYEWAWEADIVSPISETGQIVNIHAPKQEGFYTLTVQDACGIKQEVIVSVTAAGGETPPIASFSIKPSEYVDVEELVFFDAKTDKDPEGKLYTYRWHFGDETQDSGFRTSHEYQVSGRYDVKLTVTNDKGLISEAVRSVVVSPSVPKMRTEPAQAALYPGDNLEIKIAGGISPYTMTAERGQLTQTKGETTIYITPNITGPDRVLITDQNSKVARVEIEVLREIQVTPIIPLIYPGIKQRFNVTGGKAPYTWTTTVGDIIIIDSTQKSEIDFVVQEASVTPTITISDANQKSFQVFPRISTKIRLSPMEVVLKPGELHNFTAINGVGTVSWHTTGGDLTRVEGTSTSYIAPDVAGSYQVLATDSSGNAAKADIYVNLLPVISPSMSVLQTGEETTFQVFRGVQPYTWTVSGIGGDIHTNEKGDMATFQAPTQAGQSNIIVTDSENKIVQAIVRIELPNTFSISPAEIHIQPEETTNLQARGANTVIWAAQLGQLNTLEGKRVIYTAPANEGVDIVTATNEKGKEYQAIIFIGGRITGNGVFSSHVYGSVQRPNIFGILRVNEDKEQPKTVYVAANVGSLGLFLLTSQGWQAFNGIDILPFRQNTNANVITFAIIEGFDITSLPPFQIILGYGVGTDPISNMLENKRYGIIYP